jgi:hypothetical protein
MDAAAAGRFARAGLSVGGGGGGVLELDERAADLDLLVLLAMDLLVDLLVGLLVDLLVFLEGAAARGAGEEERAAFTRVGGLAFLVVAAFFDDLATETPTPFVAL